MSEVQKHLEEYPNARSIFPLHGYSGLGSSGGFEMQLEARGEATFDNLVQAADTLMYYASKHKELAGSLLPYRRKSLSYISMWTVIK